MKNTLIQLIQTLEAYNFECEAGPLSMCVHWTQLKEEAKKLPAFGLHQWVTTDLEAEVNGVKIKQPVNLCIQSIRMESNTETTFPVYGLTDDPCAPWHYGNAVKFWKRGEELREIKVTPTPNQ